MLGHQRPPVRFATWVSHRVLVGGRTPGADPGRGRREAVRRNLPLFPPHVLVILLKIPSEPLPRGPIIAEGCNLIDFINAHQWWAGRIIAEDAL